MVSSVSLYSFSHGNIATEGIEKYGGAADMNGSRELHVAHHEKRSVFTLSLIHI